MNIFSLIFGKDKAGLVERYEGFETRLQQTAMASQVMEAFIQKQHCLVEAGTGVGKSLAYLLPAIRWSCKTGKKVVISTFTKALQEQIVFKDIPAIQKILDIDFKAELCIGSQNFLCKRRLQKNTGAELFPKGHQQQAGHILDWSAKTTTGIISELPFVPQSSLWNKIRRESDLCMKRKSPYYKECFYYQKRKDMSRANLMIVNHHLFFAHVASGGYILPEFDAIIFDEAHTLEDVATEYLGSAISNTQVKFCLDRYDNPKTGQGFWRQIAGLSQRDFQAGRKLAMDVREAADIFFAEIILQYGQGNEKIRIRKKGLFPYYLQDPVEGLISFLAEILKSAQSKEDEVEIIAFIKKLQTIDTALKIIIDMTLPDYVYWIEFQKLSRGVRCSLRCAPLEVGLEFRTKVLEEICPVVFVSATLAVKGTFDFYKTSLGINEEALELIVDSPFDYFRKSLLYVPAGLPDPGELPEEHYAAAFEEAQRLIRLLQGRTFILFTNTALMARISQQLKSLFPELTILRQGELSAPELIKQFKSNSRSILLGTNTFWQGVDIPGRALECVILWKLPFSVPDDPVPEAKMEKLVAEGKNAFEHYQLPRAVMMTRQGFGRLIRTQEDKGLVAVLDPRIRTKRYGQQFVDSLPSVRKTRRFESVEAFIRETLDLSLMGKKR
ncbi:DinG family ATP-dependent helicase YoaA [hydrothermal vent metagenome]|uniref:DNA 5'-3' helicase n=1 Tax=hydrothermal vent metagenome TaxID=652676 RepID=A0A3B1D8D8_9ZZZZ